MNSKMKALKRAAAFTSALTFIAMSNANAIGAIAEGKSAGGTAAVAVADNTANNAADNPSATTTVTTTSQTRTSTQTTTTSTSTSTITTTTAESSREHNVEIKIEFTGASYNDEDVFKKSFSEKLKSEFEKCDPKIEKVTPEVRQNELFAVLSFTGLTAQEYDVKNFIDKLKGKSFKFEAEGDRMFNCTFDESSINVDVYYCIKDSGYLDTEKPSSSGVSFNEKYYLKRNSEVDYSVFNLKNGYVIRDKNKKISVKGAVEIKNDNNVIKLTAGGTNDYIEVSKATFEIQFDASDASIGWYDNQGHFNEITKIEGCWLDMINGSDNKNLKISAPEKDIRIFLKDSSSDDVINAEKEKYISVKELLEELLVPDSSFDKSSYKYTDNAKFNVCVYGTPKQATVKRTIYYSDGQKKEKDISYNIIKESDSLSNIHIPYIYQADGRTYYLKKYSYKYEGNEKTTSKEYDFDTAYENMKNSYYHKIPYIKIDVELILGFFYRRTVLKAKDIAVEYEEYTGEMPDFSDSEIRQAVSDSFDMLNIKNAKRGRNIIAAKLNGRYEIRLDKKYEGYTFIFNNNWGNTTSATAEIDSKSLTDKTAYFSVADGSSPIFHKYTFIENESDESNLHFPMTPFVIYFDNTAPIVEIDNQKYKESGGWSNENSYQFDFNVSDYETASSNYNDQQEVIDEINAIGNIETISMISVAGAEFEKPENGWQNCMGFFAVSSDGKYRVQLDRKTDSESWNGEFTATVSINETISTVDTVKKISAEGIDDEIVVMATDNCGNESGESRVSVKIDIGDPKVTSISINEDLNGNVLRHGNDMTVSAQFTDEYEGSPFSGVKEVTFGYVETIGKKSENDITKKINAGSSGEVKFELKNRNSSGYIVITVEDVSGRRKDYYYNSAENSKVTDEKDKAEKIIVDNTKPEKPDIPDITPQYSENGKNWYSDYPEIKFSAYDDDESNSGIDKLIISVNGKTRTVKIKELKYSSAEADLRKGEFYISLETEDAYSFMPCLKNSSDKTIRVELCDEAIPISADGKLEISVETVDYAGNESYTESEVFYIDNTVPEAGSVFTPVTDDKKIKKFGTFNNKKFIIRIPVIDGENTASSGFQKAELCLINTADSKEEKFETDVFEDGEAVFVLPDNKFGEIGENFSKSFSMKVRVFDNVGNICEYVPLTNTASSPQVVIENIRPEIPSPSIVGENRYEKTDGDKKELWFSSDVTVTYDVSDSDSGIAGVETKRVHENDERNSKKTSNSKVKEVHDETYVLETETDKDGKFDFSITVKDNAGNDASDEVTVYKDIQKPYVVGFSFDRNYDRQDIFKAAEEFLKRFIHFRNKDTVMTVFVKDDLGASSGVNKIRCELYGTDGVLYSEKEFSADEITFDKAAGLYSVEYNIPEGFKGDIKAWVTDNVGNKSDEYTPDGYISENSERHNETSGVDISLPSTEKRDVDGLPLYNEDVTAKLEITDIYSGIREIRWKTSDMNGWESISISNEGIIDRPESGWTVSGTERNIVVSLEREITVTNDANNNSIAVIMTDNSGNETSKEIPFSIDKKVPVIEVSGIDASNDVKYYNSHKTAHVAIAERNFSSPDVNNSVDTGYDEDASSQRNTDGFRHIKDYSFDSDGRYTLNISNTDLAGNKAQDYVSGTFVIDTIAPKAAITVRRSSGAPVQLNDALFINDNVNASVTVDEINFDPASVRITVNGTAFTPSSWSGENSHTALIPTTLFSQDGSYIITVSGTDRAGNAMRTSTASFTVDTKKPEIKISGVSAANSDAVAPVISITDSNLRSKDVRLYRNGELVEGITDEQSQSVKFAIGGDRYVTGSWITENTAKGNAKKFVFDNFPTEEIFDGKYEIKARATDMAENEKSESLVFSVNRFGSVFSVDKFDEINNKYLNAAPEIIIKERNVDKHDDSSDIVIIVDKGSNTVKLTESMYRVSDAVPLEDKSGYEYTYTIFADNFDKDLDYSISIQSVDEAGNKNVSSGRGAELNFNIDTHAPEFKCDDLVDRAEFRESERTFKLNVNENLKHVKVTTSLDEVLLDEDVNGYSSSFEFIIPASNTSRDLVVEIVDLAGNKTVKSFTNLLVTENVVLYVMHKTWAKIAGIASLAAVSAAGGFLFLRRKRKNR